MTSSKGMQHSSWADVSLRFLCESMSVLDRFPYSSIVTNEIPFPRALLRRAEKTELSLGSLEAIGELRKTLDRLEHEAILSAREKGASVQDIADVLGLTPPAIYYRLRNGDGQPTGRRGRPKKLASPPDTLGELDLKDPVVPAD
jgi:hypothetical protein